MQTIEFDFGQLPIRVVIRRQGQTKTYLLKSSLRKLAACLVGIEEPYK